MGFCAVGLCNGLMSTYSKTFGLTFINDDHYFANVAIVQNVFNGACRIFWGFGYDRLGFKTCFLVIGSVVSIATALLPTLPFLGELFQGLTERRVKKSHCISLTLTDSEKIWRPVNGLHYLIIQNNLIGSLTIRLSLTTKIESLNFCDLQLS